MLLLKWNLRLEEYIVASYTGTINNYGNDNKLELSPARNLYPDVSVMNGLSVIPRSNEAAEEK